MRTLKLDKDSLNKAFNIDIGIIRNVIINKHVTKTVDNIEIQYLDSKAADGEIILYEHTLGYIGETTVGGVDLVYEIYGDDDIFVYHTPMFMVENSNDWKRI